MQQVEPEIPQPQVKVIDDTLGERDLKVSMRVKIHGRTVAVLNHTFETTVVDGVAGQNRGIVFQLVEGLLHQIQIVTASKVNDALPIEEPTQDGTGEGIDTDLARQAQLNGVPSISGNGGPRR